ncbi:hypothetical protein [Aquisediminimonas profunda]|uniref:hypothetical protein n=1 Tax=Aquisediminimonas profunda TaxID=1550733 RepID=UPI001C62E847|nr:hypothetical protein [Aquisediminimonas profunda]
MGELIMNQNGIDQRQQENVSFFMRSLEGLAKAIALIVAFLFTPPFHNLTVGWVQGYMAHHYGHGIEGLAGLIWFGLVAVVSYHFSKAMIGTALLFGGLGIAMRLLLA